MPLDSNLKINLEIAKLEPSSMLELFELDTSTVIKEPYFEFESISYKFHGYFLRPEDSNATLETDREKGVVLWKGDKYYYYPISAEGFEILGDGSLPRPTLRFANIFPTIKDLLLNLGDLVGATVKRKRVFKKHLDRLPDADANAGLQEDTYIIHRKKIENRFFVEFELVTFIEASNIKLPRRQILTDHCTAKYRGEGCDFSRPIVIDINNELHGVGDNIDGDQTLNNPVKWTEGVTYNVDDCAYFLINGVRHYWKCIKQHVASHTNKFRADLWVADQCAKKLKSCKMRFLRRRTGEVLPFNGFPGASRLP